VELREGIGLLGVSGRGTSFNTACFDYLKRITGGVLRVVTTTGYRDVAVVGLVQGPS
jgi:hypothetical protein